LVILFLREQYDDILILVFRCFLDFLVDFLEFLKNPQITVPVDGGVNILLPYILFFSDDDIMLLPALAEFVGACMKINNKVSDIRICVQLMIIQFFGAFSFIQKMLVSIQYFLKNVI